MSERPDFIDELKFRGLFHQCTDEKGLRSHLKSTELSEGGRRAYVGFDPTADSLTIGNLVPICLLDHWQRSGHTPVVVMGGGTGLIGDPSGKTAERQLRSRDEIDHNVRSQMRIFERILDFSPKTANHTLLTNNADWLCKLSYLDALRDIGKHFSVNMMIQKESVKERLHNRDQGISYTEFSYMILQAYDFWHLFHTTRVTLQMGGSDQWGNIVAGSDFIRRMEFELTSDLGALTGDTRVDTFGLTTPLITKSDGGKFGKTEGGAVWLSADRTSPYAFYQFWLNTADADVARFLRTFTIIPHDEILALENAHSKDPGKREAQRALARHMTERLHGPTERDHAESAAKALFTGEIAHLPLATLEEALAAAPSSNHPKSTLEGPGIPLLDLLAQTSLAKSKSEARTLLAQGSISVNGHKAAADARVSVGSLLHGRIIALRRGGKTWHITRWD